MRGPLGDAGHRVIDQQVVFDQCVAGQGRRQRHIDQVDKRMGADRDDGALSGIQTDVVAVLQAQRQRQFAGSDKPHDQSCRFQPPQQRADQHRRQ
ncbi:hypothetical protein D3C71_2044670 [compost metagenome]